ncbi:MAG: S8 family peptidase [Gemmatimonadales bacterium]
MLIIDTGHERGHPDLPLVPVANCSLGRYNACIDPGPVFHGTLVSGMALPPQNGLGVVGVAPGVSGGDVFYWGACDGNGDCDGGEIVNALNWSVNNLGPKGVINSSIRGSCSIGKAMAVSAAYNAGHVIVAGVGNDGENSDACIAAYSEVIAVAGIKRDRTFANPAPVPECSPIGGSNWGDHVDVVAPYWAQSTTIPPSTYGPHCGTSLASPTVAGVALLVRARYPTWANWQVRQRIFETAEPLGPPGWDDHFGWGLVRAHLAVAFDPPALTPSVVNNRAKLTWQPIPFAVRYDVYYSITPTACPVWELLTTTTGTTITVNAPTVSSYWGTAPPYGQAALNLYVVGIAADGTSTKSSSASFLTVSSDPPC